MNTNLKLKLTRLAQATLAMLMGLEFVALQADFTTKQTVLLVLSLLCAVIPFGLLLEVRLILNKAAKQFLTAKLVPKKIAALEAITIKSLVMVKPITQTLTSDMTVDEFLIGRKQYAPKGADLKDADLFFSAVKTVRAGVDPNVVSASPARTHGSQKIVFTSGPLNSMLEASADLWNHDHIRKLTSSDRAFLRTYAGKKQTIKGSYAIALGYRLASEQTVTLLGIVTMTDPLYKALPELIKTETRLTRQAIVRALRCNLTSGASQLILVVMSVVGLAAYHLPPAIAFMQLVALDILLCAPIAALAYEKTHHKLPKNNWRSPLAFGVVAAIISYANYLLFFALHGLSPFYIDASLPMYHQATSLTLLTMLLCSFAYLLFERADSHEQFFTEHLHSNDKLLLGFGISLLLIGAIIYLPWLQLVFSTGSLGFADWSSALLSASVYTLVRLVQRHTRKHTRHAVLKLHRQNH